MTELTDRMRTCAEFLRTCDLLGDLEVRHDMAEHAAVLGAIELLREGADELEKPAVVAQPWVPIESTPTMTLHAHWVGDDLKPIPNQPVSKNACPNCDSRAAKTVHLVNKRMELECPVCGHRWRR